MKENLKTTQMRMLRTLKDKVSNEKIREMTEVEGIEEHLREQRLRWLGHVQKMDNERGPFSVLQNHYS